MKQRLTLALLLLIGHKTVEVPTSSEMGTVLTAHTEDNRPVTIQCLGSAAKAPQYQVVDSRDMGCP